MSHETMAGMVNGYSHRSLEYLSLFVLDSLVGEAEKVSPFTSAEIRLFVTLGLANVQNVLVLCDW